MSGDEDGEDVRYFCAYCCGHVAAGDKRHPCKELYLIRRYDPNPFVVVSVKY